jgi:beta-N-acetylhexosaminidase
MEGGRVARLKAPFTLWPPAARFGELDSPNLTFQCAHAMAEELHAVGINLNFAPCLDILTNPRNTVIGDRSFSSDPATVTTYAGAFARGLRDAGVLPVLKHFPGHGSGSGDSHTAGVVSTPPLSDLMDSDLVPYRTLVAEAPVAVMMGHLEVPGLTGNNPASLSAAAVNLLRSGGYGGPGFNGLVFSDDLSSMAAISSRYGVAEAVLRALQAGTDVALWITTDEVPAVLDRLESAVGSGELAMPAVEGSVLRLAGVKGPSARCGG